MNGGDAIGSIWPAMPTGLSELVRIPLSRTPIAIATGLSVTKTCLQPDAEGAIAADLFQEPDKGRLSSWTWFSGPRRRYPRTPRCDDEDLPRPNRGCAQCHNHKFDPIPTSDYYSLYGVLKSTTNHKIPLVGDEQVQIYKKAKEGVDHLQEQIDDFVRFRSVELGEMLVFDTGRY